MTLVQVQWHCGTVVRVERCEGYVCIQRRNGMHKCSEATSRVSQRSVALPLSFPSLFVR